jgi:multiple sugar transport system permease protein
MTSAFDVVSAAMSSAFDVVEDLTETQFAYLMLAPLFVLLGAMAFWPLIRTFEMSLHADAAFKNVVVGEFVGLDNYVQILNGERRAYLSSPILDVSDPMGSALTVTVIFTVASVAVETIVGFGQALVLNESFPGRRWVRVALIIPWAVPIIIQGIIFLLLFSPGVGLFLEPLNALGIISEAPLSNSQDSVLILVAADVWRQSAFMTLLILAGLQSIDRDLYRVAEVSGASRWQRFKSITFPLVLPSLLVALLFRTIGAMKIFGTIVTVSSCNTVPSLSCLVVTSWQNNRIGSSSTIAFLLAAIIGGLLVLYLVAIWRSDGDWGGI